MLRIREFENKVAELIENNEIKCPCHLYSGQEAVSVGVCTNLTKEDLVFSTHRSHGHYLAKNGNMNALMAELFGKKTGCARGKGGSMHICDKENGLLGSSAIVGGTIPIATGAALSTKLLHKKNVVVCFFGDGATNEGAFYESLNFAKIQKLPIVFVCENNFYSTHMPIYKHLATEEIYRIARALNVESCKINGNNVFEVQDTASYAINTVKSGRGPYFIECETYRHRGHVGPNQDIDKGIRSENELNYWMNRDPINYVEAFIRENSLCKNGEIAKIRKDVYKEINKAVMFAIKSEYPEKEELLRDVFKEVE